MWKMIVRCMVAAINSSGDADFYFVKVDCSEEQYELGEHYDAAENQAVKEGYETKLTFDEFESAGKAIVDHFEWDSATTILI
jgi:hypothetical protein